MTGEMQEKYFLYFRRYRQYDAKRASESQPLHLHPQDAGSFPQDSREPRSQAAWVFYRFCPY